MTSNLKKLYLRTLGKVILSDFFAPRFPVSVKGICILDNKVVLLKNERGEWDLPGGKLEKDEKIENALQREISEELNVGVSIVKLLDVLNVSVKNQINVLVVIYHCQINGAISDLRISSESFDLGLFDRSQLKRILINDNYLEHILRVLH
ncbi:MAG: NUDIX hydrolase [Bacteroidetes bacterium]|nr:MAG: NUDIX hydrolase [Bacteroidota bacterium]PTM07790.1 MAG: NUDIX hydrolase [Bacteroidota bacterium]